MTEVQVYETVSKLSKLCTALTAINNMQTFVLQLVLWQNNQGRRGKTANEQARGCISNQD